MFTLTIDSREDDADRSDSVTFPWAETEKDSEVERIVRRPEYGGADSNTAVSAAKHNTAWQDIDYEDKRTNTFRSKRGNTRYTPPVRDRRTLLTEAQNIWTPSSTKDITVHFEMDIVDDVESLLEEFSRLKRLGNFKAAEQYFQDNLQSFSDFAPVTVEYADMLFEQGAYETVQGITLAGDELHLESTPQYIFYQANLELIKALAGIYSHGLMIAAHDRILDYENAIHLLRYKMESKVHLDSAGVQMIRYAMRIRSRVRHDSNLVPRADLDLWRDLSRIYRLLLPQGRIWEVRDILVAAVDAQGPDDVWDLLFDVDIYSDRALIKFLDDWSVQGYDEPTYLAVLDILASLSTALTSYWDSPPSQKHLAAAERCLQHARILATCLKENSPELVKSRPYVRWILAEEELARKRTPSESDLKQHLSIFPGLTVWRSVIPIYIPLKWENPGWPLSKTSTLSNGFLGTVLQAAQELGDYDTEAICLGELIYRSPEPSGLFAQLTSLQKSVQGNRLGYQQTCLSKFLLAKDAESRRGLLRELAWIMGEDLGVYDWLGTPLIDWCDNMVKRAIHKSMGQDPVHMGYLRIMGKISAKDLPQRIRAALIDLGLDTLSHMGMKDREMTKGDEDSGQNPRTNRMRRKPSLNVEFDIDQPRKPPSQSLVLHGRSKPLPTTSEVTYTDYSFEKPGRDTASETKSNKVAISSEVSKHTATDDGANWPMKGKEVVKQKKQSGFYRVVYADGDGETREIEDDEFPDRSEVRENGSDSNSKYHDTSKLATTVESAAERTEMG